MLDNVERRFETDIHIYMKTSPSVHCNLNVLVQVSSDEGRSDLILYFLMFV